MGTTMTSPNLAFPHYTITGWARNFKTVGAPDAFFLIEVNQNQARFAMPVPGTRPTYSTWIPEATEVDGRPVENDATRRCFKNKTFQVRASLDDAGTIKVAFYGDGNYDGDHELYFLA